MAMYFIKFILLLLISGFVAYIYVTSPKQGSQIKTVESPSYITPTTPPMRTLNACIKARTKEFNSATDYAPGSLIVRFVSSVTTNEGIERIRSYNVKIVYEYHSTLSGVAIRVEPGREAEWACRLELDAYVSRVHFDRIQQLQELNSDSTFEE